MLPKIILLKVKTMKQKIWKDRKIPLVTLCGSYLSDAGFEPNDSAMVAIYKNTLIVRPVKKDTNE
jgi:hypothetical protein